MVEQQLQHYEQTSEQLKLLADQSRLHLLALLLHAELCVCDLVDLTGLSQPNVSQHMRKLKLGGLVHETKKGQWVYYSLKEHIPMYVHEVLAQLPSLQTQVLSLKAINVDGCAVNQQELLGGIRAEKISS
jgi:ArsR family transcriptional regulator